LSAVTTVSDIVSVCGCCSCPLKQQNYDHAMYLLAALYGESWVCNTRVISA